MDKGFFQYDFFKMETLGQNYDFKIRRENRKKFLYKICAYESVADRSLS